MRRRLTPPDFFTVRTSALEYRRYDFLEPEANSRGGTFLHGNRAGHSCADEHVWRNPIEPNADRDPLR